MSVASWTDWAWKRVHELHEPRWVQPERLSGSLCQPQLVTVWVCYECTTQQQSFNGPLSRSTQVSQYQKNHSPTHSASSRPLSSVVNKLAQFTVVHSILVSLSSPIMFFCNLSPGFLWPASRSYTFHFMILIFSPNHSHLFIKHVHTISTYFAVALQLHRLFLVSLSTQ